MEERADVCLLADNGWSRGLLLVSGARQRWRAVAVVAADARQGHLCSSRRLTGYEARRLSGG